MAIIKVENLSKKYIIGHDRKSSGAYNYSSLRDSIAHSCRGVYQRLRHPMSPNRENTDLEEFWALKDINFEINAGDKVGIIGRNGAGKSTLLKILSRITEPTTGKITMNGRVASLLEVGTGFHPELTGRENIYLNGSILGMSRSEIKKKFDEIVDFSGVEKFLDTPVKRYSSGMYVRLAFAVAAHLEPEILLIDEVLAVGDAEFQKKCLGKMNEVSKQGRTILFVSHNMGAIEQLCNYGLLFECGKITIKTTIKKLIKIYLNSFSDSSSLELLDRNDRKGLGNIILKSILFNKLTYAFNENIIITLLIKNKLNVDTKARLSLSIRSISNIPLISCDTALKGILYIVDKESTNTFTLNIIKPQLNIGTYYVNVAIYNNNEIEDWVECVSKFNITGKIQSLVSTNDFPVISEFNWVKISQG